MTDHQPKTPASPEGVPSDIPHGAQQWLQLILNQIENRLGGIETRLTGIEGRIGKVEKITWAIGGGLIVIGVGWAFVQFLLANFDVSIAPKP